MADLEKQIQKKQIITPVVEQAMHDFLGVKVEEINQDISNKLIEGKIDFEININVPFKQAKEQFKRSFVIKLLQMTNGNMSEAAKIADVDRRHMHRLVLKHKINPDFFRNSAKYSEQQEKEQYVKEVVGEILAKYEITKQKSKYVKQETTKNIADRMPDIRMTLKEALELFEKEYFRKALQEFNSKGKTAKSLKIRYETLIKKIKRLNL